MNSTSNNNADDEHRNTSFSKSRSRENSTSLSSASKHKRHVSGNQGESLVITTKISPTTSAPLANSPVYHVEHRYETYCRTHIDIVELIKQWQIGNISNFDYLLILNALAGRKLHDPNNHLIFPWINDFASPTSNLRDLSQSKYRLNKGFSS